MEELELTFLAKYLPEELKDCKSREIIDLYIPASFRHPTIRIRKNGDKYEITKKEPLADDPSHMLEQTIKITEEEFREFEKLPSKRLHKIRYLYPYNGLTAEFDIFQGDLAGLVVIDFEFDSATEKAKFQMPDFCLVNITQEEFIAGGMVCGKKYEELENNLIRFNYKKII